MNTKSRKLKTLLLSILITVIANISMGLQHIIINIILSIVVLFISYMFIDAIGFFIRSAKLKKAQDAFYNDLTSNKVDINNIASKLKDIDDKQRNLI